MKQLGNDWISEHKYVDEIPYIAWIYLLRKISMNYFVPCFRNGPTKVTCLLQLCHVSYRQIQASFFLIIIFDVDCFIYMSHFAYACKTEGENGISRLISEMA